MHTYSLNIDSIPTNIAIHKKQGDNFVFAGFNKQAELTENIKANEVIGKKLTDVFPKAKEFGIIDVFLRVEKTGKPETFNTKFYKDERISGWRHNKIIKLEDGIIAAFYSDKNTEKELENLTKLLTKTEQELEHQKNVFQTIMETSESISVQGYNEDHKIIYWNKASENIYGYSQSEAIGKRVEDLIIPPHMQESVKEKIDNWIHKGIPIHASELVLVDKYENDVNVFSQHVMIVNNEHKHELYCLDIDLSEMKKLQTALSNEKKFLETIFDVIPDLVWLKDKDGVYLKCNHRFEKLFGAKESEILGKTDFDFVDKPMAKFCRTYDLLTIKSDAPTVIEESLSFADGSYTGTFETIKTPIKNENGNITAVLGIARDISERKRREKDLETYAKYDTLTGLTNRTFFIDRLTQLLNTRDAQMHHHTVLFIDLDRFKEINDTMGHSTGDKILIMVAKRLQKITRKGDTLARLGGDEFTILSINIKKPIEASNIAQKVIDTLSHPFVIDEHTFFVTASVGIAIYPDDSSNGERLLQYADSAMYKAKDNGKNTYEFYTKELSMETIEKIHTIDNLRHAIKNHEFELYYQVHIDTSLNNIVGAEALIRWNHLKEGIQTPDKFMPLAESSGLILEIGKWVIYKAMEDISQWKKNALNINIVSINLSIKQLNDEQLIPIIIQALKDTGAKPEWIEFEITEKYLMNNPELAILKLNKLVEMGFTFSIDDFGTGNSSLPYLQKLPISKLKIDKSFVADIEHDDDDRSIVNTVILIAKSMKLGVIAEGVETQEQQKLLHHFGCNLSQGYLYSKPIPKKEFEDFISL